MGSGGAVAALIGLSLAGESEDDEDDDDDPEDSDLQIPTMDID